MPDLLDTSIGTLSFVIAPVQVNGTSYTVNTPLIAGHNYEWQVLANDSAGNESPWSNPVAFTGVSPAPHVAGRTNIYQWPHHNIRGRHAK